MKKIVYGNIMEMIHFFIPATLLGLLQEGQAKKRR